MQGKNERETKEEQKKNVYRRSGAFARCVCSGRFSAVGACVAVRDAVRVRHMNFGKKKEKKN